MWRLKREHTEDDVLQEAAAVFLDIRQRYADVLDGPKHLMGLYKTALMRRLHDMAVSSSKLSERYVLEADLPRLADEDGVEMAPIDYLCEREGATDQPNAHIRVALREAPLEVRQVVNLLSTIPSDMAILMTAARKARRMRAFNNKHLCELLGYDPKTTDLIGTCRQYFSQTE